MRVTLIEGNTIYINPRHIVFIQPRAEEGSVIKVVTGESFITKMPAQLLAGQTINKSQSKIDPYDDPLFIKPRF